MTTFSSSELSTMRTAQDNHMMDTCVIQSRTITIDSYGQPIDGTWTDGSAIACGLDMRPSSERRNADYTKVQFDATLRLPIGTTVDIKNRVKITKRFGETLSTPLIYEIVSPVQRGASGIRITLRRTET